MKVKIDSWELKKIFKEKKIEIISLAQKCGCTTNTLSMKIHNRRPFRVNDVKIILKETGKKFDELFLIENEINFDEMESNLFLDDVYFVINKTGKKFENIF